MPTHSKDIRQSLTKSQLATAVGIELSQLLQSISADGRIDAKEVAALGNWLRSQEGSDISGVQHLTAVVDSINADGVVSPDELLLLQKEIESVLPPELRREARAKRKEADAEERMRMAMEAAQALREFGTVKAEEIARSHLSRPVRKFDFLVAGVAQEERRSRVAGMIPGIETRPVTLQRMPATPFDPNGVTVLIGGHEVGHVPREEAEELTPFLDSRHRYEAQCTKTWDVRAYTIPVVFLEIYRPNCPEPHKTLEAFAPIEPSHRRNLGPWIALGLAGGAGLVWLLASTLLHRPAP